MRIPLIYAMQATKELATVSVKMEKPESAHTRLVVGGMECLAIKQLDAAVLPGVLGAWDIYLLLPISPVEDDGRAVADQLLAVAQDSKVAVKTMGPWAPVGFKKAYPLLFAQICPEGCLPVVIAGDDPVVLAAVDYVPKAAIAPEDPKVIR